MPTSGFTLFEMTRDQLITAALRKLGVLAKGQVPDAEDLANGSEALNTVVSSLQVIGMPLWARAEYTFTTVPNQATYLIGVGMELDTPFPLKVHQALVVDTIAGTAIEMEQRTIYEYNQIASGNIYTNGDGLPSQFFYQPLVNYGKITLWPTPDVASLLYKQIKIVYQRPFDDFVSGTNTLDFPQEWHKAIIYQLATTLAPEYGTALPERQMLMQEAIKYTDDALSFGNDESSLFFSPMERPYTNGSY